MNYEEIWYGVRERFGLESPPPPLYTTFEGYCHVNNLIKPVYLNWEYRGPAGKIKRRVWGESRYEKEIEDIKLNLEKTIKKGGGANIFRCQERSKNGYVECRILHGGVLVVPSRWEDLVALHELTHEAYVESFALSSYIVRTVHRNAKNDVERKTLEKIFRLLEEGLVWVCSSDMHDIIGKKDSYIKQGLNWSTNLTDRITSKLMYKVFRYLASRIGPIEDPLDVAVMYGEKISDYVVEEYNSVMEKVERRNRVDGKKENKDLDRLEFTKGWCKERLEERIEHLEDCELTVVRVLEDGSLLQLE